MSATMDELILELPTRRATRRLGEALGRSLEAGDLLVLEGQLGAGKTFLTRAIARQLGVPSGTPIRSPTFALLHEYAARLPLVHGDLYRLESAADLHEIGLSGYLAGSWVVVLEWAERFAEVLPRDGLWIRLSFAESSRRVTLQPRGTRGAALFERLRSAL